MQDAYDFDAVFDPAVEQDMRPTGEFVVASSDFGTCAADGRILRSPFYSLPNLAQIRFGLVNAPGLHGMVPDFVKISLRAR